MRTLFIHSINENPKLRTWGEHVVYKNCSECQKHSLYIICSPQVWAWFSYYGLVDAKIRASDKDLPVPVKFLLSFFHVTLMKKKRSKWSRDIIEIRIGWVWELWTFWKKFSPLNFEVTLFVQVTTYSILDLLHMAENERKLRKYRPL